MTTHAEGDDMTIQGPYQRDGRMGVLAVTVFYLVLGAAMALAFCGCNGDDTPAMDGSTVDEVDGGVCGFHVSAATACDSRARDENGRLYVTCVDGERMFHADCVYVDPLIDVHCVAVCP
jgi:hypothetical protein